MLPYKDTTQLRITQTYGNKNPKFDYASGFHSGLDFVSDGDKSIVAIASGWVIISQNYGRWGNYIVIRQEDGLYCVYAHLSKRYITSNQSVVKGEVIGVEGSTGFSKASHLHIELQKNYYDPFSTVNIAEYLSIKNEVGKVEVYDDYDYLYNEELIEAVLSLNAIGVLQGYKTDSNGKPLIVRPKEPLTNERFYIMMNRMLDKITFKVVK